MQSQNQDQKIIDLLKKINELAKNGVDGEKQNASQRLEYLMKKYGVTFDMIESDTKTEREFVIREEQKKFFAQIVFSVCGLVDIMYYKKEKNKAKSRRFVVMSDLEFIEVSEKFSFYWNKYEQELIYFYKAFIHKNKLTTKPNEDRDQSTKPTPEEIEEYRKIMRMMEGIDKYNLQKQLENK